MNEICREVKDFLESLRRELPGIFPGRRFAVRKPVGPAVPPPAVPADQKLPSFSPQPSAFPRRKLAGELIRERVKSIGSELGLEYKRVFIKDQKSLWASCSGRRNLNFNWRLAAAPPEILDYVVIHELCHLREMNHSKKFWDLVGKACPAYKIRKKWLRENSAALRK
ncbi:MAG: M48 family metallopeptidase [Elusimicrobiales bacterium]|jgi:hypothetical protein